MMWSMIFNAGKPRLMAVEWNLYDRQFITSILNPVGVSLSSTWVSMLYTKTTTQIRILRSSLLSSDSSTISKTMHDWLIPRFKSYRALVWDQLRRTVRRRLHIDSTIHDLRKFLQYEWNALIHHMIGLEDCSTVCNKDRDILPMSTHKGVQNVLNSQFLKHNFNSICILWLFL